MKSASEKIYFKRLLPAEAQNASEHRTFFALLNLGVIEGLANGSLGAAEAVRRFYHAENCLFVRNVLKDKTADRIMSHGTELGDLFDALPVADAQREFQHELSVMKELCLRLLERGHPRRQVA